MIFEFLGDLKRFHEIWRVFSIFRQEKSAKIRIITANPFKKRKKIIKKLLKIINIFAILNAVKLLTVFDLT